MSSRRDFLQKITVAIGLTSLSPYVSIAYLNSDDSFKIEGENDSISSYKERKFNGPYSGSYLNRLAFPIGGIGTGMECMEGTGAISHVSVRNALDIHNETLMYAALSVKGKGKNIAKVLQGPVPERKYFAKPQSASVLARTSYGLPRLSESLFLTRLLRI